LRKKIRRTKGPRAIGREPVQPPPAVGKIHWVNLGLGLLACWFGIKYMRGNAPNWLYAVPLQLFAAWKIITAFPKTVEPSFPQGNREKAPSPALAGVHPRTLVLIFASAGLSIYFFHKDLMVLGVVLVLLSALLVAWLRSRSGEKDPGTSVLWGNALMIAVLAAAALMRFPFVGMDFGGFQNDESNNLFCAIQVATGHEFTPFGEGWSGTASFLDFLIAPFFKVFGISLPAARAASATFSMLGLFYFYRLCRFYFSEVASAMATFLFSIAFWELFFSASGFSNIITVFFEVAAFYYMTKALREGKRLDFWWGGLFTAASAMSYLSGRLVPVMIFLFLLACLAFEGKKFWKTYIWYWMLSVAAFSWLVGTYLLNFSTNPQEFFGRTSELSIFSEIKRTGDYLLPLKTFAWTALSFFTSNRMEIDARFALPGYPMVDAFSAVLAFVGLVLCLITLRKRLSLMCLVGFSLAACANSLAINGPGMSVAYINGDRLFLIIPFVFLMAGRSLDWIFQMTAKFKKIPRIAGQTILAAGLLGSLAFNIQAYYFQFRQFPPNFGELGYSNIQLAHFYRNFYPSCHILSHYSTYSMPIRIMDWEKGLQVLILDDYGPAVPIDYQTDKNIVLVFPVGSWKPVQEKIKAEYPNAVWTGVYETPGGNPWAYFVEIGKDDIIKKQAGLKLKSGLL